MRHAAALFALALCAAAPLYAATEAALPPIERFFINPTLREASLSPSGRYLAAISGAPGRRDYLAVIDLQANSAKLVAGYKDVDIRQFSWVNDNRLAFNVNENEIGPGGKFLAAGLYAVDRDGSNLRQLAQRRGTAFVAEAEGHLKSKILPWHTFLMDQRGAQDSDAIYVESYVWEEQSYQVRHINLLKLNTVTGTSQVVQRPAAAKEWTLDAKGEPRLVRSTEKDTTTLHYRDPATGAWRVLTTYPTYASSKDSYEPLGFGGDGTLYAVSNGDQDTRSLYTVNLATGKLNPEPVVVTPGYDFDGELVLSGSRLLGIKLHTDAEAIVWFDTAMQETQKKLDAALPGTVNQMSFGAAGQSDWALVKSYSDRQPEKYNLFNLKTGALNPVGESYPGIDPKRMGRQEPVRYKARDGLEIPALLTLPANGARNAPLVVLVHGGPYLRGTSWGWHPETQFLASRGYAVLEPEFRGSMGYGNRHFRAGWKQWGLAMQDDIADGARWAIAQGHADPKRICIAGASYGGYATLMGLVKDPDLYKCGVDWVGVTDINLLYDGHWSFTSDLSEQWKQYGMPELVGDQVKDAAQLKATSPITQAARIKAPLLLAYGGVDRRVPMYHGRKFLEAVKPHNKQVEWISYDEEGHGWQVPANRVDYWSRVEKFLDKHIGSGAKPN
ncbi:S9 family peptidase [Massilia sp. Dwa41.01b]|nr:S9 family peptidase [Massilia sp. Dwa41.01b]QNB01271.1 S9 family peptidase [Massilia sp. Se16.2.3]